MAKFCYNISNMTKLSKGFTAIEIIFVVIILGFASILFFVQKDNIETIARDNSRKVAINAMYYSLEKSFYAANDYYPESISSDNLTTMDPDLFTDPDGTVLGEAGSNYTYAPTDCSDNKCKSYTLTANLENEADYVKKSTNQ